MYLSGIHNQVILLDYPFAGLSCTAAFIAVMCPDLGLKGAAAVSNSFRFIIVLLVKHLATAHTSLAEGMKCHIKEKKDLLSVFQWMLIRAQHAFRIQHRHLN